MSIKEIRVDLECACLECEEDKSRECTLLSDELKDLHYSQKKDITLDVRTGVMSFIGDQYSIKHKDKVVKVFDKEEAILTIPQQCLKL